MPANESDSYNIFVLRFWQESHSPTWRILLENAQTGQRHGFTEMSQLYAFLEQATMVIQTEMEISERT